MTLLSNPSAWFYISSFIFASLAGAQTQTVYLTQTQTVYTSCNCPGAILSPLPVSVSCIQSLFGFSFDGG